jgi:hypothetical protein
MLIEKMDSVRVKRLEKYGYIMFRIGRFYIAKNKHKGLKRIFNFAGFIIEEINADMKKH